ncbi:MULTISPECIES: S-layer homology domain-containing protein [unclassified Sporosarcina]|uniref:S-layer homology domain-containing protein n=1 Tax=unclassified Sporosarcina TaxID=2647733 RepID=UPI00203F4E4A|nr:MULTISPECIES: S-layer homology domain-containing protein [unclassified Sporosarcina]GKV66240.1 hypothetical protein NCCP2331_23930 [Sporosarcina sp. NCCP-2331]GLB56277.1 hypothetical protein NCCP2378_20640 [Sporosarcina sp. NCCP-2378]
MANQPTKYRKFVVGAASAALVASAVAPVAFAADFSDTKGNTHEEAIKALSDAGVITGYPDGTFKPNKTLTRSDVVKLMGKWLVSEGYKVPADAQSKPRFADLKSTSNKELLEMAAVVFDNGVFVGTPDGKLDPTGDITRENMAIVIVRAFDRVHDIDLASYVAAQDFKKDVTDLGKAKAEARPAIDVLDFFDITNPAAPQFNPKETTTRGHFATFLHKTLNADFSDVEGGVVAPGVASVKAVNATTVEVTFKDAVDADNLNSLHFSIDGLTVSNAAVKQTDDKTVVLTTATQKGGEKYTVTLNEKAIGSFTGVSAVVPEKINLNTKSVQGVVGQQVILSADIGVKEAGVPVTFNVKANTTGTLNKDQVFEVVTNADGIATFSYTQYNAGNDTVTVYPTGKADLREQGTVYWENAAQLTIKDITEATTLANGSKKAYEINSAKNANKVVFVTFKENLNVTPDKLVKTIKAEGVSTYNLDTVTGVPTTTSADYPYKASTGGEAVIAVKLDGKGKANLVLTGANATATPIVYEGKQLAGTNGTSQFNFDAKYDARAMQASATPVTFNVQHALGLTIAAEGVQNAATYKNATETGGRDYTVTFNTKDGKAAAPGTVVNVAINTENIKGSLYLLDSDNKAVTAVKDGDTNIYKVLVEKDGKATFTVASTVENDYVAPVAFIDNGKTNGKLDADDLQTAGEVTYFVDAVEYTANLKAVDKNGKKVSTVVANGAEPATFIYQLVDQNGKPRSSKDATTVSFEVQAGTGNISANGTPIAAGTTKTVPAVITAGQTEAKVNVVAATPTTATVTATGSKAGVVLPSTNPSSVSVNFSQYGSAAITGTVTNLNTALEVLTINDTVYNYANAKAYQIKGSAVTKSAFESEIVTGTSKVSVTVDADGKFTFNVLDANATIPGVDPVVKSVDVTAPDTIVVTFSDNVTPATPLATQFAIDFNKDGVISSDEYATVASTSTDKLTLTFASKHNVGAAATVSVPNLVYTPSTSTPAGNLVVDGKTIDGFNAAVKVPAVAHGVTVSATPAATPGVAASTLSAKLSIPTGTITTAGILNVSLQADKAGITPAVTVPVSVTLLDDEKVVASKIAAELNKLTVLTDKFTVTSDGADVVVVSKDTATEASTTLVVDTVAGGTAAGTAAAPTAGTSTAGVVGSTAVTNAKFTAVTATANVKPLTVNVYSNGKVLIDKSYTVAVNALDTADTVATKVAAALNADTTITNAYTVTVNADTVTLTNKDKGNYTTTISVN